MVKKRLALITTWFPPTTSVAVNRMKAFATYLSEDFNVTVYTVGENSLSKEVEGVNVHYFKTSQFWEKAKHNQSDNKITHHLKSLMNILADRLNVSKLSSWKKNVLKKIMQDHEKNAFDIILSSYAPTEVHDISYSMKTKFPSIKWVADMRDEMSANPFLSKRSKIKMSILEEKYSQQIDLLSTVSLPILEDFKHKMPNVPHFLEVRNGYNHNVKPKSNFNNRFTFVYAGSFYGKIKPDIFLKILGELKMNKNIPTDFKINFVGTAHNFSYPKEIETNLHFIPKVSYDKAIEYISEADCNLLFHPPVNTYGRYTGKVFDYLSVEKPILAPVDVDDVAAELINEHKAGFVVDFYNENDIKKAILAVFELWENKKSLPINSAKTTQLHRKYQVQKLSKMIFKLLEE